MAPGRFQRMNTRVLVNDKMQRGYVYYRTEPMGRNFAPGFAPELTPAQMLRLGVFGGCYMTIARHAGAIRKHCEPGERDCRPRQRQALLHWAYDSRKI